MKQWLKEKGPGLPLKVLLSALTPVTAFFLMQWIYAGEFQAFPFYVILANGICLAAFYYLAAAATGRLLLARGGRAVPADAPRQAGAAGAAAKRRRIPP